jgi:hypothetical protein
MCIIDCQIHDHAIASIIDLILRYNIFVEKMN